MKANSVNKFFITTKGAIAISFALALPAYSQATYTDWATVEVPWADDGAPANANITYDSTDPHALGLLNATNGNFANISVHGCLVHSTVAGGTHLADINGTSTLFSTADHTPSIALTDHLVTDAGQPGSEDLVFDFGGAVLRNPILHLSDAFRDPTTSATYLDGYTFTSADITGYNITLNPATSTAGSHQWNMSGDLLRFGRNSPKNGTIQLMGDLTGFTMTSSVENYTRFQIGADSIVPEPSTSLLFLLSGLFLNFRRRR